MLPMDNYKIKDSTKLNTFGKLVELFRVKKDFRKRFISSFPNSNFNSY